MTFLRALAQAFRMYSKIPVPAVPWEGKHARYTLCCFPLVGAVIGGAELLWWYLTALGVFHPLLSGCVAAAIPIVLTGGIHLDGFMDTCDALASHQSRERMLEIMKDSHIGAFAPISLGLYLMGTAGAWTQVYSLSMPDWRPVAALALLFPAERCASALLCLTLPNARGGGLLFHFAEGKCPLHIKVIILVLGIPCLAGMALLASWPAAVWYILPGAAVCIWFRRMTMKVFGGITGDLAGWFLQMTELAMLLGFALWGGMGLWC